MGHRAWTLGAPGLLLAALATPALAAPPGSGEDSIPAEYVFVEGALKAADESWIFLWAGTCRDPEREVRLQSLSRYRKKLHRRYERLSGRVVESDIIIMEGDSCTNTRHFEGNLGRHWRMLSDAQRALDRIAAGRRQVAPGPRAGEGPGPDRALPES